MNMRSPPALILVLLGLWLASTGCGSRRQVTASPTISITQAYQTVAARLTQAYTPQPVTATHTPGASPTPANLTNTATATQTLPAQTTGTPPTTPLSTLICDRAAPGNPIDVTIPDDTEMRPGEAFTKIWRLENVGECTWSEAYAARFFYGTQMGAPDTIPFQGNIAPGQTVDISVDMTAPIAPGTYQGNWKLRNAAGVLFGIGPNGDAPFWVRIVVVESPTETPTPTVTPSPTPTPSPEPSPSATATATPPIQSSGTFTLALNDRLDLDTAQLNPEEGGDLLYQRDGGGFHILLPQASALLGFFGNSEPGLEACREAAMSTAPIALESLNPGAYLCYQTNQGLVGRLRYNSFEPAGATVNLDFLTWVRP